MSGNAGKGSTPMTKGASSRIQSGQATGGKNMSSSGFAARAQSAGDRHANAVGNSAGGTSGNQGGGQKK